MITENQRIELKNVLRRDWANDVLALLKSRKIKNKKGKWHSKANVRQVMYGNLENESIERAILDVYESTINSSQALKERKKRLLAT